MRTCERTNRVLEQVYYTSIFHEDQQSANLTKLPYFFILCKLRGGCSSVVESQIVDLVVAGSNPVIHPKI